MKRTIRERLLSRIVLTTGGCWEWQGAVTNGGYGRISVEGKTQLTHRVSYREFVGPIPGGHTIDHRCRNIKCCNYEHLEPVTMAENNRRGNSISAINARKERCPTCGGEFVFRWGRRDCPACLRRYNTEWKRRRKNVSST